jgi:hypothetical protein
VDAGTRTQVILPLNNYPSESAFSSPDPLNGSKYSIHLKMNSPMLLRVFALILTLATLRAADVDTLNALRAADDERVGATIAADRARLAAILADDLRYAHSTGTVDTKNSLIDSIASGRTKYNSISYEDRSFEVPVPGIALMSGRALVKVSTPDGDIESILSFLAVWQEMNGKWHFRAWQSCKIPNQKSAALSTGDGEKGLPTLRQQMTTVGS